MPHRTAPTRAGDGSVPALPCFPAHADEPIADPHHAHLFAWRSRGGGLEEMPGQAVCRRAAFFRGTFDAGTPSRCEHRRQRKDDQQRQRRMNRIKQHHGHAEAQDPAAGGKQRHVHVVEHEDLVAQHRQPIEVFGPLVVLNGGDRGLQPRDVRFQRNRHPVTKTPLRTVADHAQKPGRRPQTPPSPMAAPDHESAVCRPARRRRAA